MAELSQVLLICMASCIAQWICFSIGAVSATPCPNEGCKTGVTSAFGCINCIICLVAIYFMIK